MCGFVHGESIIYGCTKFHGFYVVIYLGGRDSGVIEGLMRWVDERVGERLEVG